jgi:hypothetical protein
MIATAVVEDITGQAPSSVKAFPADYGLFAPGRGPGIALQLLELSQP